MSTNSIHSQMQTWLNKHGENINNYSSKIANLESQMDELEKSLQGSTSNKDTEKLTQEGNKLQLDYMQAELDYLKQEAKIGNTFDFMEGDYDISDADTFIPAYAEQTAKLAQGDMDAWETDGEEGISMEEYRATQLAEITNTDSEEYNTAKEYTDNTFKNIDIDGDGILEKNELQGFYAAIDNADGSVDGKISTNAFWTDYTSEKFKNDIEAYQQYLA